MDNRSKQVIKVIVLFLLAGILFIVQIIGPWKSTGDEEPSSSEEQTEDLPGASQTDEEIGKQETSTGAGQTSPEHYDESGYKCHVYLTGTDSLDALDLPLQFHSRLPIEISKYLDSIGRKELTEIKISETSFQENVLTLEGAAGDLALTIQYFKEIDYIKVEKK